MAAWVDLEHLTVAYLAEVMPEAWVTVATDVDVANRLPAVLVAATAPKPVGNAAATYGGITATVTLHALASTREDAADMATKAVDLMVAAPSSGERAGQWFSWVRPTLLPVRAESQVAADHIHQRTAQLAVTARIHPAP